MDLYFSPMACSLATRISLYEAGADANFIEVDPRTKLLPGGEDFRQVNPLGLVPVLRTDDGELLTENAAILQYVADRFPLAHLAPESDLGRTRLQQWLCFIGTELHKPVFGPLLDKKAPEVVKAYALEKAPPRLDHLDRHLSNREFLLDHFTVADAYLLAVLNWTAVTPIELPRWPALASFATRMRERPSVARAISEERRLYAAELARHARA